MSSMVGGGGTKPVVALAEETLERIGPDWKNGPYVWAVTNLVTSELARHASRSLGASVTIIDTDPRQHVVDWALLPNAPLTLKVIGRPNWRRSRAYPTPTSRHQRPPPAHSAAAITRARSRTIELDTEGS